jgi:hypothetical protein
MCRVESLLSSQICWIVEDICWIVEKYPWSQIQGIIQIYKVQASFKVNLSNHFNWLKSDGKFTDIFLCGIS